MYTVVGSGFGLYGYLPALVTGLGETVLLPRAWEAKVRGRPELADTLPGIRWVDDTEAAIGTAESVVIATPPIAQVEWVRRCVGLPNVRRLVLEKPVAATPSEAADLLSALDRAGKRYRIGYTMLHTGWHSGLAWPGASSPPAAVRLDWTFLAHHFAQGLSVWKRRHEEGGGALRFFGIHVIALLANQGYLRVRASSLQGAEAAEPELWRATFAGPGLPDCEVVVNSRCDVRRFSIGQAGGASLVALADPFGDEIAKRGEDPRVSVLTRLLATFDADDRPLENLYRLTNRLWAEAEDA